MFHRRDMQDEINTGSLCHRDIEGKKDAHRKRRLGIGTVLGILAALTALGCSDGGPGTVSESPTTIAEELQRNAQAFQYVIGQPGGTLTSATVSEPLTLNLAVSKDTGSSGVLGYLFEGLTETSWLTDEVEPALAESWTHSEDGLTWIFLLRQDVRWHDGEPFTAHDVAFTFNDIIYNPDIDASARPAFNFRFLDDETHPSQIFL